MPIDNVTRLRRMRSVLQALIEFDLGVADTVSRIGLLKARARVALQEAKLGAGNPALGEARKMAHLAHKRKGKITAERVLPIIKKLRTKGFDTYQKLAEELNRRKVRPPMAKKWSPSTVFAVEKRNHK